ncbi:MAG: Coenzyme F420 hydrogenase/dehydrogenase, beta subunit C-terminal domain [Candidatus Hodarchaeota archaeon]
MRVELPDLGFKDLVEIARAGRCSGCGTCTAACPLQMVEFENDLPTIGDSECLHDLYESCGLCYLLCPQTTRDGLQAEEVIANPLGKVLIGEKDEPQIHLGYAADPVIREKGQSGGLITAALVGGLKTGYLDAVTIVKGEENLETRVVSATTGEEVINGAGTQYTRIPVVEAAWSLRRRHGTRFAFTGTPCMILGMRALQKIGFHESIKATTLIGVFCSKSFQADPLRRKIQELTGRSAEQVSRIAIKGKVSIAFADGDSHVFNLDDILAAAQDSCQYCPDFLAEYADISVGEMGAPPGHSIVLVRTQKGYDLLANAQEAGELVLEPCDEKIIKRLKKWAKKKRDEARAWAVSPLE